MGRKDITHLDRVKEYLEKSRDPCGAYEISKKLKLSMSHARSILSKLYNKGEIEKTCRGYYRALYQPERIRTEMNKLRMHGIKLQGNASDKGRPLLSAPPQKKVKSGKGELIVWNFTFRLRSVTITQTADGLIQIWVKAGKIDEPDKNFTYWDYAAFLDLVETLASVNHQIIIDMNLVQWGFNADMRHVELSKKGTARISAGVIKGVWGSMYQKTPTQTRLEVHGTIPINAREALEMIKFVIEPPNRLPEINKETWYTMYQ